MLKMMGVKEKPGCHCREFADFLDQAGKKWCENHFHDIIKELGNRAREYGYPFSEFGARIMLKVAIKLTSR
jgi:hypothetical protein